MVKTSRPPPTKIHPKKKRSRRRWTRGNAAELEEQFRWALDARGIEYRRQYRFDPDSRRRADFFVPPAIIVECQGIVYGGAGAHNTPTGVARDMARANDLIALGFTPLWVTNHGRGHTTPEHVADLVLQLLSNT